MQIHVCIGSACHLKGSYDVIKEFEAVIKEFKLEDNIILKGAFCLNHCTEAVSVKINDEEIISMKKETVRPFVLELIDKYQWNS